MNTETLDPIAALEQVARRQRQEKEAGRKVETARAKLMLDRSADRCFFKVVALQLDTVVCWDIPTAATDGHKVLYNPEFIEGLSLAETIGVMCGHEPMHCALNHHTRRAGRNMERWKLACEFPCNEVCKEAGFTLPADAVLPGQGDWKKMPPGLSAEEYYNLLPEDEGEGNPDPGGIGTIMDAAQDEAGNTQQEQKWERTVAQAAELTAKEKGKLPGRIAKLVDDILNPKVPWQDVLRDFVSRVFENRNDYSWRLPNRRYITQGMYLPSLRSESLGHIVVAIDTSQSVNDAMLEEFGGELNGVLSQRPCRASVVYCDAMVHKVVDWTPSEGPLKLEAIGRGGTDHVPVFEWVDNLDEPPAAVVCLTDLETSFPDPPDYPVLWGVPKECRRKEAPFGRVIEIG